MGLRKHAVVNIKRSLQAMKDRWILDSIKLEDMGFRYDEADHHLTEVLRNIDTAIANIDTPLVMPDSVLNRYLTAGREATATETVDATLSYAKETSFATEPTSVTTILEGIAEIEHPEEPFPVIELIYEACDGCGAARPSERCIGCFHDFGHGSSDWVYKYTERSK